VVTKASSARVETADYIDQAGLVEKYKNDSNIDVSKIETVDYVLQDKSLLEAIPYRNHYDYIIASHVIEHIPDLLRFLHSCDALLSDSGVLALVVPDRRYCFDLFRPSATAGAILQAYREKRSRHTAGTLFDQVAYASRRGPWIAWTDSHWEPVSFVHTLSEAAAFFANHDPTELYADCHAWQFTPSSFRLIMRDLADIGYLNLRECAFHDTCGCEFFIGLARSGAGCPLDRTTLALKAVQEAVPARLLADDASGGDRPAAPPADLQAAKVASSSNSGRGAAEGRPETPRPGAERSAAVPRECEV
jgi:SAM-dependent methyltransferase